MRFFSLLRALYQVLRYHLGAVKALIHGALDNDAKVVLVMGDSHAAIFNKLSVLESFSPFTVGVVSVGGATISGLNNPNSKTQSSNIFGIFRRILTKQTVVVLQLGEVDIGFLVWLKSKNSNTSPNVIMHQVVEKYCHLILQFSSNNKVIVVSAPLPTIADNCTKGDVAFLRKGVESSQLERTNLTLEFNQLLDNFCKANGVAFIKLDDMSIDPETGLVRERLKNTNPLDHHYDETQYVELLESPLLKELKA